MANYKEPAVFTKMNRRERIKNQAVENEQAKPGDIITRGNTRYLVTAKGWRKIGPEVKDVSEESSSTGRANHPQS